MQKIQGSDFSMKVDMVVLAMGFEHVVHGGIVEQFGLDLDGKGNIGVDGGAQTSHEGVFAAGDSVTGASLVVRAIASGRQAAESIDRWLDR
jgi:glutamate synthase (NADPH/NADH) small chain